MAGAEDVSSDKTIKRGVKRDKRGCVLVVTSQRIPAFIKQRLYSRTIEFPESFEIFIYPGKPGEPCRGEGIWNNGRKERFLT